METSKRIETQLYICLGRDHKTEYKFPVAMMTTAVGIIGATTFSRDCVVVNVVIETIEKVSRSFSLKPTNGKKK